MSRLLGDSGFASLATEEIETLKWGKLLSNVLNALEVLCGPSAMSDETSRPSPQRSRRLPHSPQSRRRAATTLAEKRSKLVNYHSIGSIRRVGSSSWQSVLRGTGNVETDYLNGEIASSDGATTLPRR